MKGRYKTIGLLGVGWLGHPLGLRLMEEGYEVKGTTTTPGKLAVLEKDGIRPYCVTLGECFTQEDERVLEAFLEEVEVLLINIPPKLRRNAQENFVAKMAGLIPYINKFDLKEVVFISSTAVYNDQEAIAVITEQTEVAPLVENGRQLFAVEQLLRDELKCRCTVIRFGGLIGADRHPVKYLAGKINVENPMAPINLIHLNDCLAIILICLASPNSLGHTFNAVAPVHLTREEYYTKMALKYGVAKPLFVYDKPSVGKIIESRFVKEVLQYDFDLDLYV